MAYVLGGTTQNILIVIGMRIIVKMVRWCQLSRNIIMIPINMPFLIDPSKPRPLSASSISKDTR
jgi:Ca2+/Na+ antiporter